MKVLIKKATILHPGQEPGSRKDILVEDGMITQIAASITDGKATIIESKDLHVSPGWLDIGAQAGQPGYEYRETFQSLTKAARAGGYTSLATFPRNNPAIHSRIEVDYVKEVAKSLPIRLLPIGAISHNLEGKDLTEMMDMIQSGVLAFSDGRKQPVEAGLLSRALEYVLPFQAVIMDFPLDKNFNSDGQMHEGRVSASLGLSGIPSIAEEIIVQRDVQLLAYTGSRLHLHAISSATSLPYIQRAKSDRLMVTCDVPAMHLLLEDEDVGDFDSYKKVLPPLRNKKDRKALIKAVKDGLVDHISSIHTPMEVETKDCEFTYASFGSISLETSFAAAHTALYEAMPIETITDKFCAGPYRVLGIEPPAVKKGVMAELTLFDPGMEWLYEGSAHSLSKNDALAGRWFTGKVLATVRGEHLMIN